MGEDDHFPNSNKFSISEFSFSFSSSSPFFPSPSLSSLLLLLLIVLLLVLIIDWLIKLPSLELLFVRIFLLFLEGDSSVNPPPTSNEREGEEEEGEEEDIDNVEEGEEGRVGEDGKEEGKEEVVEVVEVIIVSFDKSCFLRFVAFLGFDSKSLSLSLSPLFLPIWWINKNKHY